MTRNQILAMRIGDVPFTTRTRNVLIIAFGHKATVQELTGCTEAQLLSLPNFGRVSLMEVILWLAQHKLQLNYTQYATSDTASIGRIAK